MSNNTVISKYLDTPDLAKLIGLLFGGTLMMGVGLWDDVMNMRARNKFIAQFAVALIAVLFYGFTIYHLRLPHFGLVELGWFGIPFSLFWYLGMVNAINFLDGLDGLVAGYTTIACIALTVISLLKGQYLVAITTCALAGAAAGFLPFNYSPARIFMGDGGSLFIGFVLATIGVMGTEKEAVAISLVVPLLDSGAAYPRHRESHRAPPAQGRVHLGGRSRARAPSAARSRAVAAPGGAAHLRGMRHPRRRRDRSVASQRAAYLLMCPLKVAVVFGTRPDAVKMAPVVHALALDARFECMPIATGQHRELRDEVLALFGIMPEHDLEVMTEESVAHRSDDARPRTAVAAVGGRASRCRPRPRRHGHLDRAPLWPPIIRRFPSATSRPACAPTPSTSRFPRR